MAVILNIAILDSAILVFPFKLTHTCQDWFPPFAQRNPSLIHSDSTWWWQPSWTLPCWIQPLPFWIQTPCYLLSDSLQNTLTPLWFWLKLILSHWNFIDGSLILMMAAILNSAILNSALLIFPLKLAYTCQDWFPPFAQKKLYSFILTQLDDGSLLKICLLWYSHFAQKKPHWFILPQLDDGSLLVFCTSWIQTPCYLLWDSLQNTLPPHSDWN